MTSEQKRYALILAVIAAVLVALWWWTKPSQAATTVNIPFPKATPVWVPEYTKRADSWPVSLVFAPFVIVMSAVASVIEAPFAVDNSKNLRKTAAVMTIDAVRGKRKFSETRKQPKTRVITSCTYVGNWQGAPCQ